MNDVMGRSDFLDAATVLRKNRGVLETRRKEIDAELTIFKGVEEALVVLGEADRVRGEVEAKIRSAQYTLAELNAKVLRSEAAAKEAIAGFEPEVEKARQSNEALLSVEKTRKEAAEARIQSIREEVEEAEKAAGARMTELSGQITEKETALASLRQTIASLAKL